MALTHQTQRRLPTIKAELLNGTTYQKIGELLGVSKHTIDRDVKAWLSSEDFDLWLKEEWVRLHNEIIATNPTEAYRNLTKIVSRMVVRRAEIRQEIMEDYTEHIILESLTENEKQQLDSLLAKLQSSKGKGEPGSIH